MHQRAPGYFWEAPEAPKSALEDDFERASLPERPKVDLCNTLHAKTLLLWSPGGIKTDRKRFFCSLAGAKKPPLEMKTRRLGASEIDPDTFEFGCFVWEWIASAKTPLLLRRAAAAANAKNSARKPKNPFLRMRSTPTQLTQTR